MSDAVSDDQLTVCEIKGTMDAEAFESLEEGLDSLIVFITNLNERMKQIYLELNSLESFRRVFIASNIFIVPVIIAIVFCYGARDTLSTMKGGFVEACCQAIVRLLLSISGSIGLPFYIYTLWSSYQRFQMINKVHKSISIPNCVEESQIFVSPFKREDSFLACLSNVSSMEKFNELSRILNITERIKKSLVIQRSSYMLDRDEDVMEAPIPSSEAPSETETMSSIEVSSKSIGNQQDYDLENDKSNDSQTDFPVLYEFQVRMRNQSPDLSIRIEPAKSEQRVEPDSEMTKAVCTELDPFPVAMEAGESLSQNTSYTLRR